MRRAAALGLVVVLAAGACGFSTKKSTTTTTIATTSPAPAATTSTTAPDLTPPTASAEIAGTAVTITAVGHVLNVDGVSSIASPLTPAQEVPNPALQHYPTTGGVPVVITFHTDWPLSAVHVQLAMTPVHPLESVMVSSTDTFVLPTSPPEPSGNYVYSITGTWPEGVVTYYLIVDLKDR
jgi:hypothetical protein